MKALTLFIAWCILFVLAWPVALLALGGLRGLLACGRGGLAGLHAAAHHAV